MSRTGTTMTKERKQLIAGLRKIGGGVAAEPGKMLRPAELAELLGVTTTNLTPILSRAERDGIVSRTVNGRRTLAIQLVEGDHLPAPPKRRGPKPHVAGEPTTRKYTRRTPVPGVPLPQLGETVTVSVLSRDRDGSVQLGIQGATGAWMTTVNGFAALE